MQFRLRRRKAIHGLRFDLHRRAGLLLLVITVGFVGHHAHRGQAPIGGELARAFVLAQQQAQRTTGQGALAKIGIEHAAQATRCGCAWIGIATGGFQQVV